MAASHDRRDNPSVVARVALRGKLVWLGLAGAGLGLGLALALTRGSGTSGGSSAPAAQLPLPAQASWPPGAEAAPNFSLRDQQGRPISLRSERGHPVLLTFLNSYCRQACPVEGRLLGAVWQQRAARFGPALLVVSINPWRDTPQSARRFMAEKVGWGGHWHWLFGTPRSLARVWRAYEIVVKRASGDIGHGAGLYMIDSRGFERRGYLVPFTPATILADLRAISRLS